MKLEKVSEPGVHVSLTWRELVTINNGLSQLHYAFDGPSEFSARVGAHLEQVDAIVRDAGGILDDHRQHLTLVAATPNDDRGPTIVWSAEPVPDDETAAGARGRRGPKRDLARLKRMNEIRARFYADMARVKDEFDVEDGLR